MANSRKLNSDPLVERTAGVLHSLIPPAASITVGLSGGLDSVVLLHMLSRMAGDRSWRLSALHIHHGISPNADQWAEFCHTLCQQLGIPFSVEHVDIRPLRDQGVEAAARQLRHAALNRQATDFIALAHHRDDQVETMLLQLLRGAGVKGAAAMPMLKQRPGLPALVRPLLKEGRRELLAYAQRHHLRWVEDESNADEQYPRNFLRHQVLPLIESRYPGYRATLARCTEHFAEADALLDELARQDAAAAVHAQGVSVESLRQLSPARARNVLRYFIASQGAPLPDHSRLFEMVRQLCEARRERAVQVAWQGWQLRSYRGYAQVMREIAAMHYDLAWQGQPEILLPGNHGQLRFVTVAGQGIKREKLQGRVARVRSRQGGECMQVRAGGQHRSLKNLAQELGIPPWQRQIMPLLFCDNELVWAPQIGVAAAFQATAGEAGILVEWC